MTRPIYSLFILRGFKEAYLVDSIESLKIDSEKLSEKENSNL